MLTNKYHIRRALWGLLLTSSLAIAGGPQHFGFTLNVNSKDDVIQKLKARHAVFDSEYGYKGYGNDLPVIKVSRDSLINAHGEIDEAWLQFTPDKKLFRITVTWRDEGTTYKIVKQVFDEKYRFKQNVGRGFVTKNIYEHGDTKITLTRNSFGIGENQKTSVEYLHLPALPAVQKMKDKIDRLIKNKTIKNKGVNL